MRRCVGGDSTAEWLPVDFSGCGISITALRLCEASQVFNHSTYTIPPSCVSMGLHASMQQLDSDNEQTAVVLVNITASTPELEVTAIAVMTSIVEDLTPAAIDQPEVCSFPLSPLFFLFPLSS